MRTKPITVAMLALLAMGSLSSAWTAGADAQERYRRVYNRSSWRAMVPAGTTIPVRVDSKISSSEAERGDGWTGTVTQSVFTDGRVVIPAGTQVQGVVSEAVQGTHNNRPVIALSVRNMQVDGRWRRTVSADADPIVAGSNRAKKLGIVGGSVAAGALIGNAVGKDTKSTVIGGLLGGAAGYGLSRHALRTMHINPGTVINFTTRDDVAMRR